MPSHDIILMTLGYRTAFVHIPFFSCPFLYIGYCVSSPYGTFLGEEKTQNHISDIWRYFHTHTISFFGLLFVNYMNSGYFEKRGVIWKPHIIFLGLIRYGRRVWVGRHSWSGQVFQRPSVAATTLRTCGLLNPSPCGALGIILPPRALPCSSRG